MDTSRFRVFRCLFNAARMSASCESNGTQEANVNPFLELRVGARSVGSCAMAAVLPSFKALLEPSVPLRISPTKFSPFFGKGAGGIPCQYAGSANLNPPEAVLTLEAKPTHRD